MSRGSTFQAITESASAGLADEESAASRELIRDKFDDLGLSVAEAAAGLGITRQQLYNVLNGKSGITPEMAVRLEKAFGGSAEMWLRMQGNFDLAQIRQRDPELAVTRLTPRSWVMGPGVR